MSLVLVLPNLNGLYEHSPWVVDRTLSQYPQGFASLAALKAALAYTVQTATRDEQLALIRAHPELAGKAMVDKTLTSESTNEQGKAGLTHCTADEFAKIQKLNSDYNTKFGWPFILAVRGPRGTGLTKAQIMQAFERRLAYPADYEMAECLRQINRIAEIRLDDKYGVQPSLGNELWDWHEALAAFSDPEFKERGELTVTYLTKAHLACAALIKQQMQACGFDDVRMDAVGNVVGIYWGALKQPLPTLLTGSHYDTVRNGGKYDGRLGIYVPMLCVRELHKAGKRLPFNLEVVGFAEEEGQRYKATFLGSGALTGDFDPAWLDQQDADGITMRRAMLDAGLPASMDAISSLKRDAKNYLGFVEVHIEQGPVLNELNLPLGVVTSINGSVRYLCRVDGMASHAGTTPMMRRKDAAAAVAEMILAIERCAKAEAELVATVGQLHVPSGSINVVAGACTFSIDLRAPVDAKRDALEANICKALQAIADARGVSLQMDRILAASAAPSHPAWQARWEDAVQSLGLPVHRMNSGAGHDAMKLHTIMPQAMLFVRGENAGISHNPLESTSSHDMDLAVQAFQHLLNHLQ
ncbi:MAG: 2-oxo-4-hydroxy-4-carboxy-5-ureidoimidazoline decarboxylase [Cytophagales bacterium]|nr:2-oxo-4-hydroxy-4-carboxy-5-ureidoimidazoline decarboxylase [Cytophagales bacterium]